MESSSTSAERTRTTRRLVARDRELAWLGSLIAGVSSGSGAAVVVEGPAGIGKTALLAAAAQIAAALNLRVLRALGGWLEHEHAFGVVRELFGPAVTGAGVAPDLFDGAAGLAAAPLGLTAPTMDAQGAWGDPASSAMHGLYWLTTRLAEVRPLVLMLDDAHWADVLSLRFLLYLARRLDDLPVLVLLATRPHPEPSAARDMLRQLRGQAESAVISLEGLTVDDAAQLVAQAGLPDADPAFVAECHHACGGNPFLLVELLTAVRAEGATGRAADIATVARIAPESVVRWVTARLTALGSDAERLACAVAVLASGATLSEAAELARVTDAPEAAADALIAAHILSGGPRLRFVHPLIEVAAHDHLAPATRAEAHARAARMADERGASLARVAGHLLVAGPGGPGTWAAQRLRAAALEASAAGAPASAATYLERALMEPLARPERAEILVELGEAQLHAGVSDATERLREALVLQDDPRARAEICLATGRALFTRGQFDAAKDAFRRGFEEAPEDADDLRLELRAWYITDARHDLPLPAAEVARLTALLDAESPGVTRTVRNVLAQTAYQSARLGDRPATEVARLARRALADGELLKDSGREIGPYLAACYALVAAGSPNEAVAELTEAIALSQRRGSSIAFGWFSHMRGIARFTTGALLDAIADMESAWQAFVQAAAGPTPDTRATLALARMERDDPAGAGEALGLTDGVDAPLASCSFAYAVGRLRAANGHPSEGLQALMACERLNAEMRAPNPAANLPWRADAALLATQLGDSDTARRLIEENLELAIAFGAPQAIGVALRTAGLLEGGDAGLANLAAAVSVLEGTDYPLHLARALVEQGAAMRRAGRRRDALQSLRRGLDLAADCGALALSRRAREELVAAGARPRRERIWGPNALTASELRVARMAADGMSNPQIAQALFISRKTVTLHLTRVYQKLGIEARAQLAESLSSG